VKKKWNRNKRKKDQGMQAVSEEGEEERRNKRREM
jgi:hypothetical protein